MFEKNEVAIQNVQFRDTGNIRHKVIYKYNCT
jgi:hypothetical protein